MVLLFFFFCVCVCVCVCFNRARTPDSPFAQYFLKEFDAELGVQCMDISDL